MTTPTALLIGTLIVGAVLAALVLIAIIVFMPRRRCPGCGQALPRFRKPADQHEALYGGWTCAACGTRCDRHGRPRQGADTAGA